VKQIIRILIVLITTAIMTTAQMRGIYRPQFGDVHGMAKGRVAVEVSASTPFSLPESVLAEAYNALMVELRLSYRIGK
jgi:hypothetical protein